MVNYTKPLKNKGKGQITKPLNNKGKGQITIFALKKYSLANLNLKERNSALTTDKAALISLFC